MAKKDKAHLVRSGARRKALQLLFESTINGLPTDEIIEADLHAEEVGIICEYTKVLLKGVSDELESIDAMLEEASQNWTLERMPLVDKSILRIATYEMMGIDDVPYSVSINEAVELAKYFGGEDDSPRFVNGVLGQIAARLQEQQLNMEDATKAPSKREMKD